MKKLFCVLLAIVMLLSLAACGESKKTDRLAEIKERGYIEMCTEPYFAPNEFIDPSKTGDEQYVGIDIEIGKYIAEKIGVELKIVPLEFGAVLAGVAEGKYDMAISAMAYSPSRAAGMNLSPMLAGTPAMAAAGIGADSASMMQQLMTAISGMENGSGGNITIPVYIGQDRIDEIVVTAAQRANYRSGGR